MRGVTIRGDGNVAVERVPRWPLCRRLLVGVGAAVVVGVTAYDPPDFTPRFRHALIVPGLLPNGVPGVWRRNLAAQASTESGFSSRAVIISRVLRAIWKSSLRCGRCTGTDASGDSRADRVHPPTAATC